MYERTHNAHMSICTCAGIEIIGLLVLHTRSNVGEVRYYNLRGLTYLPYFNKQTSTNRMPSILSRSLESYFILNCT